MPMGAARAGIKPGHGGPPVEPRCSYVTRLIRTDESVPLMQRDATENILRCSRAMYGDGGSWSVALPWLTTLCLSCTCHSLALDHGSDTRTLEHAAYLYELQSADIHVTEAARAWALPAMVLSRLTRPHSLNHQRRRTGGRAAALRTQACHQRACRTIKQRGAGKGEHVPCCP